VLLSTLNPSVLMLLSGLTDICASALAPLVIIGESE
jgi:hypothetical protein